MLKPHEIPDYAIESLRAVFCGEGADLEPEHFKWVAVLVDHEIHRRQRARRAGAAGASVNKSNRNRNR
jgi:hypothetical protein